MPITSSKQTWAVGASVKVGFMRLTVREHVPTPGDGMPDQYRLEDTRTGRRYTFTPHNGLERDS